MTRKAYAFKFNACKLRQGAKMRDNFLMLLLKKDAKTLDDLCPLRKGLKINGYNETFSDSYFPPTPTEVIGRSHKEVFGKIKGLKKWTKLYTQDVYFRIKK